MVSKSWQNTVIGMVNFLKFSALVACQKDLETVKTQIGQSDQGLPCLLFQQAFCEFQNFCIKGTSCPLGLEFRSYFNFFLGGGGGVGEGSHIYSIFDETTDMNSQCLF